MRVILAGLSTGSGLGEVRMSNFQHTAETVEQVAAIASELRDRWSQQVRPGHYPLVPGPDRLRVAT